MRQGGVETSDLRFVPEDVAPLIRAYRIFSDDIFISVAGTLGIVGRIPAALNGANLTENADRITSIGCDVDYLMYSLLGESIQSEIDSIRTVGAQPKLALGRIKQFEIPIPKARAEQERVAQALHDTDDLIGTLTRLIAKKQAIKRGMMQQLLTGRTRLPGFNGAWSDVELGSVANVNMGQSPAGTTYNSDHRGVPLIQGNADIRDRATFDRIWTTEPTRICDAGDVLLTVRAPVGYTALASKRSCLGRGVCAISAHRDNRFLFHALVYAEPAWALYEQGSTFTAVNSSEVRSFVIRWPSDIDERTAIAAALDDTDRELATLMNRLAKARDLKIGMMQQLLTGRTRLPMEALS